MVGSVSQINNPSYGALKEDLNLTPKEAAEKAKQGAQDSWVGSIAGGLGSTSKDMSFKKMALCALGTVAMVFGISLLGKNTKMFGKVGEFGDNLTNSIKNAASKSEKLTNAGKGISEFSGKIKKWFTQDNKFTKKISKNLKAIFGKNAEGINNVVRPKSSFARPMIFGTKWEVVDNALDPLQAMFRTETPAGGKFSQFTKPIRQFFKNLMEGPVETKIKNQQAFKELLKKGGCPDVDGLCEKIIKMSGDVDDKFAVYGEIKKYLPTDMATAKELFTQKVHGFNVGFFDSIKRAELLNNSGDGKALYGAKTSLGRILQKGLFRGMEAPSNGVASKTVMGFGIALPIYWGVFNKVYDTKKGEKVSKFAEETVTDMGNYMMIPVTAGVMYTAASLKYFGLNQEQIKTFKDGVKSLSAKFKAGGITKQAASEQFKELNKVFKNGNILEKIVRFPAKVLGLGLEAKPGSVLSGKAGGALRLLIYMTILSPLFAKPVKKLCHTIFGTPSDTKEEEAKAKAEKEAKKAEKAMRKNGGIGMTQEELIQKLSERPQLMEAIQNDPKIAEAIQKNPMLLVELINQTPAAATAQNAPVANAPAGSVPTMSPALQQRLNNQQPAQQIQQPAQQMQQQVYQAPQTMQQHQAQQPTQQQYQAPQTMQQQAPVQQQQEPPRNYIPSSAPVAQGVTTLTQEQQGKLQNLYAKADKAEAEAMKFLQ